MNSTQEFELSQGPRIYVACLASYNDGVLHGTWIDATQSAEAIEEEVKAMLALSGEIHAKEWAIHDTEGFEGINISEWESFEQVSELANMLTQGDYSPVLIAKLYNLMGSGTTAEQVKEYIEDYYRGAFTSLEEYAYDLAQQCAELELVPKYFRNYIDFAAMGRDAELSGDIFTIEIGNLIHVFWNA